MELQEIEVVIDPDGTTRIQVRGVPGAGCLDLTADLEAALGGEVVDRQLTPEAQAAVQDRVDDRLRRDVRAVTVAGSRNTPPRLRMHGFEPYSAANGPGTRAVVWVQGCTLACAGCFNPETHGRSGAEVAVDEVFGRIVRLGGGIEGVTVTGGEPLQQRTAVLSLLTRVRTETPLSTLVFTGYRWAEVARMPDGARLRDCVDVLLAGRYEPHRRTGPGLAGSANKTVHLFSDRYTRADLARVADAEVIIRPDGAVVVTGVDPPTLDPSSGWT